MTATIFQPGRWRAQPDFFTVVLFNRLLPWLFCLLFGSLGWLRPSIAAAQTPAPITTTELPSTFLPKSPTVASFQRFDKQSYVNLMTGAAQTSVPLATIESGALQVNVALNYSFDGLRVAHVPDLVGLGWSLQAGGSISRRVVGNPDEVASAYGHYSSDTVGQNGENYKYLRAVLQGNADACPDIYDFSVAGYHGRFLVQNNSVILLPQQPLQIQLLPNEMGFQLAAETGVRYVFTAKEETVPNHNNFSHFGRYASAWHLTQMISAGNTDTIRFHYSDWQYYERPRIGQTTYRALIAINGVSVNYSDQAPHNTTVFGSVMQTKVLDSITTKGSRILLQRVQRDSIRIVRQVNVVSTQLGKRQLIRSMVLGQSYFTSLATNPRYWRLRLDWIQERNESLRLPAYRFAYDTTYSLPPSFSLAQDHWGFYNGATNNGASGTSALLPHPQIPNISPAREPDPNHAAAGALRRITFPTGGTTTFAYESNRYEIASKTSEAAQFVAITGFSTSTAHPDGSRLYPATYSYLQNITGDSVSFTLLQPTTINFILGVQASDPQKHVNRFNDFILLTPKASGDSVYAHARGTGPFSLILPAGKYTAWALCESGVGSGGTDEELSVDLSMQFLQPVYTPDVPGNGVRVKQTETVTAGAPPLVRTYSYVRETPQGLCSSGTMLLPITGDGKPIYSFTPLEVVASLSGTSNYATDDILYENTTSDITAFGDEYSQYTFYYSRVTEQEGSEGAIAGKTVHYFASKSFQFKDVVPTIVDSYLGNPALLNSLRLVKRERQQYTQNDDIAIQTAMRPYRRVEPKDVNNTTNYSEQTAYSAYFFSLRTFFYAPDRTATVQYQANGDSVVTASYTGYEHYRPKRLFTRDSQGNQQISHLHYLSEYGDSLSGVTQLRAHNFNPIIEVQQWEQPAGRTDSVLVGGKVTLYDARWQQPASTWHLELAQPQLGLNAQQQVSSGLSFFPDTRYRRKATEYYDAATGDPIGQQVTAGPAATYVWGYRGTEVIAQVQNARPTQVAYTSFEARELGRWQGQRSAIAAPGYTGLLGYNLSSGLSCANLPTGQYRLSCRRQGTNGILTANGQALQATGPAMGGWTEYAVTLTVSAAGTVQLSGTGQLDEIRLCPVGARLTSYTHEPLVGMTSQTGPDGRTQTYEYDGLGRLMRTRDEQGRILGQQQYHYAGQ